MSLFGGVSSVPPTESEYESGSDNLASSIEQSPSPTKSPSPPSAQKAQDASNRDAVLVDAAQNLVSDDADGEESDEEHIERPNRFKGPPQTWKGYTAVDRQIAESLQQLEDSDISTHLFNAHALKRRVRRPAEETSTLENWQNKDAWLKQGIELQYTDGAGQLQTELVPTKDWTAWPLPPGDLFTLDHGLRRSAIDPEEHEWVIGGSGVPDAGEELKDEMLGLFLRLAKENWNAKQWDNEEHPGAKKSGRRRARIQSKPAQDFADVVMKDGSAADANDNGEKQAQEGGMRRGRPPQPNQDISPAVLADDVKAERLLRPTIASMLDKLDDVALALQRTRLNHLGRGAFGDASSQSEFTTDAETTERESPSRPQSKSKNASRKPSTRPSSRVASGRVSRAKSSPQKPQVHNQPEDSDSASDYGAQFENIAPASGASGSTGLRRKRSRSESTVDEDDVAHTRDWSRTGLMDWSEVLSIAAIKGWNEQALARTAQRCAALFGESMSFIPLQEALGGKSVAEPVHYTASTIPAPITASRSTKRPYYQPGAIRCPHSDCYGHHKDFAFAYRVIEHCMRVHGYDPRSNDSDNEERTHGGVHIDGFQQPITAKQGWLGHGRLKAGGKKRKTEEVGLAGRSEVDVEVVDE